MSRSDLGPTTSEENSSSSTFWNEGCFRRILVAFDGSPGSWKALRMSISLAWQHDAELWAISVEESLPRFPATVGELQEEKERADRFFEELHQKARALAGTRGIHLQSRILCGRSSSVIARYADEGGFDLVVLGCRGRGSPWKAFTSTAGRVGRGASCSVMIVR